MTARTEVAEGQVLFTGATFRLESDGLVAQLTLSRPEVLNRLDETFHRELSAALNLLSTRTELRALVLAADGKVFSAGGDFAVMKRMHDDAALRADAAKHGRDLIDAMLAIPVPVVAALHGDAIGLGASLVLLCDAVVAARTARLADPHVCIGLVAGDGGCAVWPPAVGMMRAKRHLLTGDPMTAEDGFAFGLVTDLVDSPDEVWPAAKALASRVASLPPQAVQGTKRVLNHAFRMHAEHVVDLGAALELISFTTDDLVEAIRAFEEQRPGSYKGH